MGACRCSWAAFSIAAAAGLGAEEDEEGGEECPRNAFHDEDEDEQGGEGGAAIAATLVATHRLQAMDESCFA